MSNLHLRDGEHVIATIRRSLLAYSAGIVLGIVFVVLAFFLIVPLFARGVIGTALFGLLIAMGAVSVLRALWFWYGTAFIITEQRIIDVERQGVFHKSMAEARFDRVEDISVRVHGILSTVFQLGTIRVQATGASAFIEIRHVRHPARVHELLGRYQHTTTMRPTPSAPRVDLARFDDGELLALEEHIAHERARRTRARAVFTPDPLQE